MRGDGVPARVHPRQEDAFGATVGEDLAWWESGGLGGGALPCLGLDVQRHGGGGDPPQESSRRREVPPLRVHLQAHFSRPPQLVPMVSCPRQQCRGGGVLGMAGNPFSNLGSKYWADAEAHRLAAGPGRQKEVQKLERPSQSRTEGPSPRWNRQEQEEAGRPGRTALKGRRGGENDENTRGRHGDERDGRGRREGASRPSRHPPDRGGPTDPPSPPRRARPEEAINRSREGPVLPGHPQGLRQRVRQALPPFRASTECPSERPGLPDRETGLVPRQVQHVPDHHRR